MMATGGPVRRVLAVIVVALVSLAPGGKKGKKGKAAEPVPEPVAAVAPEPPPPPPPPPPPRESDFAAGWALPVGITSFEALDDAQAFAAAREAVKGCRQWYSALQPAYRPLVSDIGDGIADADWHQAWTKLCVGRIGEGCDPDLYLSEGYARCEAKALGHLAGNEDWTVYLSARTDVKAPVWEVAATVARDERTWTRRKLLLHAVTGDQLGVEDEVLRFVR
jgi:hypothetical protein